MISIAFGHRKNVGKDTAARFLCSYLRMHLKGSNIQFHGFADKGKEVCHELYGWGGLMPGHYYEEPGNSKLKEVVLPKLGKSPRQIWIDFMSLVGREVYPATWVDYLHENVKCDVCIIKDLRFPNEADRIHHHGGYIYRLDRADAPNNSDIADDPLLDYPDWDGILQNNGTLGDFNKVIEQLGANLILQLKKRIDNDESQNPVSAN